MSRWQTQATREASAASAVFWKMAYADAGAWPEWNEEIRSTELDRPLALCTRAKVRFETGLRFASASSSARRAGWFTDESRLPVTRMGHRHQLEVTPTGTRLTNTIYIEGPLAWLWRRVLGPRAARALPDAQERSWPLP